MTMTLASHTIVGDRGGPHLLITGGVHGDEFEPMAAARRLIARLQPGHISGRVTIVPVVNEAAFRRGARTAEDGLDLARTCPGRADGSVTEQTAHALSALIRTADYYIDLHTGGTRLQVQPLAGYVLHPDPEILAVQRRMARVFGLPFIWGTDWRLEGRSLSVARDAGVPAIYCEYLGGGLCRPEGVEAYVRGCLRVMVDLGLLDREQSGALAEPAGEPAGEPSGEPSGEPPAESSRADEILGQLVAEDPRPGAGHMQVNLPAPMEGFFEPEVTLGQAVVTGDLIGRVTDPLGQRREPVFAPHAGLVIVLHTFSRVEQGESLGVVLDQRTLIDGFFANLT